MYADFNSETEFFFMKSLLGSLKFALLMHHSVVDAYIRLRAVDVKEFLVITAPPWMSDISVVLA